MASLATIHRARHVVHDMAGLPLGYVDQAPAEIREPITEKPPRSLSGRRLRVYPPSTPRVKVYHPLDEGQIPPGLLHDPQARRFYRFVREELEMPQRHVRILEHCQEVIAVDQVNEVKTTMIAAPMPEPLIER